MIKFNANKGSGWSNPLIDSLFILILCAGMGAPLLAQASRVIPTATLHNGEIVNLDTGMIMDGKDRGGKIPNSLLRGLRHKQGYRRQESGH